MYYKGTIFIGFALLLSACGNDIPDKVNESQSDELYQPIEYTEDDGKKEGNQIPTGEDQYFKRTSQDEMRETKYSKTNRSHDNAFNNEESMAITQEVNELKEITMTQAFTNGEKAYVAVMVNPYDWRDEDIEEKILEKAQAVTDLPVVVYTNINSWEKKKDVNARRAADEAPDKVRERIRDFFKENEEE
ncbi:hypothetical protein GCM10010954_01760 [Halobacillus andaensis]|uniref:Sporulation lipoprotein YhcN/YlaJ (Spore_YhcN_YlaJ) n=1 Tax=Halobacillus andaensis TaxID=1176239 RepID=A0A917AXS2_HALAA|nr:YhcN/YlaJ family sporulation lipoprotein [Halobacillus andaensis]MBP2002965.1 hypothetical protein [Halobacillus andaensis]GGF06940.1 hypothetical protein GCM10010954_01760 [Halobacillus andaensis]